MDKCKPSGAGNDYEIKIGEHFHLSDLFYHFFTEPDSSTLKQEPVVENVIIEDIEDKESSAGENVSRASASIPTSSRSATKEKVINININLHVHDESKDNQKTEEAIAKDGFEIEVDGDKKSLSDETIQKINKLISDELAKEGEDKEELNNGGLTTTRTIVTFKEDKMNTKIQEVETITQIPKNKREPSNAETLINDKKIGKKNNKDNRFKNTRISKREKNAKKAGDGDFNDLEILDDPGLVGNSTDEVKETAPSPSKSGTQGWH